MLAEYVINIDLHMPPDRKIIVYMRGRVERIRIVRMNSKSFWNEIGGGELQIASINS